jgi:orotate phosphoribosyltransferase
MRYYQHARLLSAGLSRLLRDNAEIRAIIPELSIVTPANAGLPVAYGVCEALRARQVYWAEREDTGQPMRFSGRNLREMQELLESRGARVVALAVIVYQPTPRTRDFGELPLYYLAKLNASYFADAAHCDLCEEGAPLQKVWM